MTNQELIINGQRINLGVNFGVRLNRQLLSPAELNTKDAQFSYSISVPTGGANDIAFNYSAIEETRDKFNRLYDAEYIVNGVRIFRGNFKLTSVTAKAYKGNLYVPAPKTIKDIFGEIKLNQNPELRIPFADFATSVNGYNAAAANEPQYAIFPYVLYGVLPKSPLNKNANVYSARTLWDASVRVGLQDLPPSINPLLMLKHIFKAQGYTLQGSAFDDDRLTRLYLSYKNADDYVQPWNYGQFAKIHVRGGWSSRYNYRGGGEMLERGVNQGSDSTGAIYACDLFDATNTSMEILQDTGGNVLYSEVNDGSGRTFVRAQVRIPTSGFYKVKFNSSIRVDNAENWRTTDPATGVQHVGGRTSNAQNNFGDNIYEVRLCRDRKTADFGLNSPRLNGLFYYNNQPQNQTFDGNNIPKYFPQVNDGQTNFVDLAQDKFHLLGFNFGRHEPSFALNPPRLVPYNPDFYNPKAGFAANEQILVAKPAVSWDASEDSANPTRLAVKSAGYWKYGRIGNFDNAGDNPDIDIDYSGGTKIIGKDLDDEGNPIDIAGGNLTLRVADYYINATTGLQNVLVGWEVSDFINLASFVDVKFTATISALDNAAVVLFYDGNFQKISVGVYAPSTGASPITYTDQAITPPAGAVYARFSAPISGGLTLMATGVNIILSRFPLSRFYTYRIETDPADNYAGVAYIHNGAETFPISEVPFINGVAEINTSFAPLLSVEPKLTIYLRTPSFDVDGTLTISRRIENSNSDVVDWELTNKYKIDLNNAPENYARRGQFNNIGADANWNAQGNVNAVVWLDAGELLTVASISSEGRYRRDGMHSTFGWASHEILYDLDIQPFRTDPEWLKVNLQGNGTEVMDWNDAPNFDTDSINLVGFLNADIKTDEFIDNFCKAFNLRLSQIDLNTYALDVKQSKTSVSSRFINLDKIASVKDRENTPLGLPSLYKLGFTVDIEERGYVESGDNGGGEYETGAIEGGIVEQKSTFSYNWFKNITKVEAGGNVNIGLPIISKDEVWNEALPYPEAMRKRFTDLAYRFWYYDGLLTSGGATFNFNGASLQIARVSNQIANVSILNYKNQPYTILDNYFTVLINGSSHYTELEGYLTATMYAQLDGSLMAMFNGDLYFIAELGGYDPTGKNKTNIKLIRKL